MHQDIRPGCHRLAHIAQAGALLQDRIVALAIPLVLQQRLRRGHEQALGQSPHRQARLLIQPVFSDILAHQGRHTGNLRRRHGGAGHLLILVVAALHAASCHVQAVDGVDVAARRRDFRFQAQVSRHAPAGKVAHCVVFQIGCSAGSFAADCDCSGVILHTGDTRRRSGGSPDQSSVLLGDGHAGSRILVIRQVHVDHAGFVVVHNGCNCPMGHSGHGLG